MNGTELIEKLNRLVDISQWMFSVNDFVENGFSDLKSCIANGHVTTCVEEILEILEEIGDANVTINTTEPAEYHFDIYKITHFPKHGIYLETKGEYNSYEGSEFKSGFGKIVKPVSKTVIVFE